MRAIINGEDITGTMPVDQQVNPESENPVSGKAVDEAINGALADYTQTVVFTSDDITVVSGHSAFSIPYTIPQGYIYVSHAITDTGNGAWVFCNSGYNGERFEVGCYNSFTSQLTGKMTFVIFLKKSN